MTVLAAIRHRAARSLGVCRLICLKGINSNRKAKDHECGHDYKKFLFHIISP
jgi:hypothetical protein